jgi:hypothetical protein
MKTIPQVKKDIKINARRVPYMRHPAEFAQDCVKLDIPLKDVLLQLDGRVGCGGDWVRELVFFYDQLTKNHTTPG